MSYDFKIDKLILDFKKKEISKKEAIEILLSLIESSDDVNTRLESINFLIELDYKSKRVFEILEACLVSDENALIRGIVARLMLNKFPKICFNTIKWVIHYDRSVLVLKCIKDYVMNKENEYSQYLSKILSEFLAEKYGVIVKEAFFLLDLEYIKDKNLEIGFFKPLIKKERIISLDLAGLQINKIPYSIGNLTELINLNLWDNNLVTLPRSIENLQKLKYLYLDWNQFSILPNINWMKLKSLKKLSLTNNINLTHIPKSLFLLSKRNFSKKYINEGVNLSDAPLLGLLEILTGQNLSKVGLNEELNKLYACNYRINKEGNIIGIYLYGYHSFKINLIPEQIFSLKFLEELILRQQNIKSIPDSIKKLKFLKRLDLMSNKINKIPRIINELISLKFLDLEDNLIKEQPKLKRYSEINLWF